MNTGYQLIYLITLYAGKRFTQVLLGVISSWLETNNSTISPKQILVKSQLGSKTESHKVRHNFIE